MEENKDTVIKNRHAGACIKYGYNLFFGSLKRLLKSSWQSALAYALVCSALGSIAVIYVPRLLSDVLTTMTITQDTIDNYHLALAAGAVLVIVGGLFEILSYSRAVEILMQHQAGTNSNETLKWNRQTWQTALHTLKGILFTLLILAVPTAIWAVIYKLLLVDIFAEPNAHIASLIVVIVATMAVVAFLLPLAFVMMKYLMEQKASYLAVLKENYIHGLWQMGFSFIVIFINILVIALAVYVILQPAIIISMANYNAHLGQIYGDPLGMPEHAALLTAVVFFLAGFIQIYIRMTALFTLYYMYGTIEARKDKSSWKKS